MIGSNAPAIEQVSIKPETLAINAAATVTPPPASPSHAAVASPALFAAAGATGPDLAATKVVDQVGLASWYDQGRLTASGERFDPRKLTAAHRTLPLDTKVKVTNLENGKSVEVKVNDRGPYISGRVLDLSSEAAKKLGMTKEGLALVRIEVLTDQLADAVN
ncbi:MAG TPA: septal ring lytic transglycosylase RlpA family protein [Stellaceae bacterium]|jgi:rare lipoprotein A|nr:septal ring lytic transglycosylase RlpA family protein [Stellaceae bacterium]